MPDPKNRLPESHVDDDGTPATSAPEVMPPRPEPESPRTQRPDVPTNVNPAPDAPELTIPVNTVAWIILKAREFDMKEPAEVETDEDDGHNPLGVLEDRADDATGTELRSWIADLNDTEQAELVALMWLGRGDDGPESFPEMVEHARGSQAHGRRTVSYLLGTPRLGDYLEEGLEKLGVDTANLEGTLR